jgi:methionyl-tRNA synthetase
MNNKTYYLTTPIYYVNDIPHIGHAYTTIAGDAMCRYKRMKGFDTFYLTGTDEHGQKVQQAADAKGMTPQQLVDEVHQNFRDLWKVLGIAHDDFIRTTEPRHELVVQTMFKKLMDKGDIYKGTYEGLYCVPCETYVPESSVGEGNTCPDCKRPLMPMQEESYFFRASKYVPTLIKHYENNLKGIIPQSRYNEILSFLHSGVRDQSVSRTTLSWGIPIPGDEKHVIYVWFDALINYASAVGYIDDRAKFEKLWPEARHLVGKDIIRFHCVVWPLMLIALGLNPPVAIIAHGWWTVDGEKMSKSKGNVVDPFKMAEVYGADSFRYFLLREVPFGNDGDFSERALVGRINSDLANDLGNLLNRTLQMIVNYCEGKVPEVKADQEISSIADGMLEKIDQYYDQYAFDEVLKTIWSFISRGNKYIDETMPWKLAKEEQNPDEAKLKLAQVLRTLYEILGRTALLISPFMPDTANKLWAQLGLTGDVSKLRLDDQNWDSVGSVSVRKAEILFPRIDIAKWEESRNSKKNEANNDAITHEAQIEIENFRAVELRVAQIEAVSEIPKVKKLYKLDVNLGYEKRVIVAGIREHFLPEELVGKRIIVVANLKPAILCGVESNGMLLAASSPDDKKLTVVVPEKDIPLGSRVR